MRGNLRGCEGNFKVRQGKTAASWPQHQHTTPQAEPLRSQLAALTLGRARGRAPPPSGQRAQQRQHRHSSTPGHPTPHPHFTLALGRHARALRLPALSARAGQLHSLRGALHPAGGTRHKALKLLQGGAGSAVQQQGLGGWVGGCGHSFGKSMWEARHKALQILQGVHGELQEGTSPLPASPASCLPPATDSPHTRARTHTPAPLPLPPGPPRGCSDTAAPGCRPRRLTQDHT